MDRTVAYVTPVLGRPQGPGPPSYDLTWKSYASDGGGAVAWGTRTASPAVLKTQKASRPTRARRHRPPLRAAPRRADPPLRANAAYDDDDYAGEASGDVPRRPGPPVATMDVFAAEESTLPMASPTPSPPRLRKDDPSDAPDAEKAPDAASSPTGGSVKGVVTFDRRFNDLGWAEYRTARHSKGGGASGYVPLWDQWGGLPYQYRP